MVSTAVRKAYLVSFFSLSMIPKSLSQHESIGGSVVESSPATRGARVRFPANAFLSVFAILAEQSVFRRTPTLSTTS